MAHFHDMDMAGFDVHFDFGEAGPMNAVGGQRRLPLAPRRQSASRQSGAGLFPIQNFSVAHHLALVKNNRIRLRPKDRRHTLGHLNSRIERRILDGRRQ